MVIAGSQEESGVVLDVFAADCAGTFDGEFYGVAQTADGEFAALESLADDVDGGVVFVFFGDEGNLRAGDDERDRKIVMRFVFPEIGFAGIDGDIHTG